MDSNDRSILAGNDIEASIDFVLYGRPPLPTSQIGNLSLPKNSSEAKRCNEIASILKGYTSRNVSRPLSVAVFGPPGSGKSFCVEQISKEAGCGKPLIINVSQLSTPRELAETVGKLMKPDAGIDKQEQADLAEARDEEEEPALVENASKTQLFFFDEFDTSLAGESLGWLQWFLAPMQDGVFMFDGHPINVGKTVFIFAGGTAVSLSEFEKRALEDPKEYRQKKVPDFISRLRGFVDIEGVNGIEKGRATRRALVLRRLLQERWPKAVNDDAGKFPIEEATVRSLLSNVHFVHGVRSMEALLDMSRLADGTPQASVQLPNDDLRKLHLSRGLLDKKLVGISAGQKDDGAESLLKDLADGLLRNGASLAYGGDFTPEGTLSMLVEAAAQVPDELITRPDRRIRNYLAFPGFHNESVRKQLAEECKKTPAKQFVDFLSIGTLSESEIEKFDVPHNEWFPARDEATPEQYEPNRHLAWAISLFRMRARLIQDLDALIVVGGRDDGKSWGRFSGIAEEVMLALAFGKPVYVLGGRGGGANAVGRLLGLGDTVANVDTCLNDDLIDTPMSSEKYANYFRLPGHLELPRTVAGLRMFLFERGITTDAWPRNGLGLEENRELFRAPINGEPASETSRKRCMEAIIAGLLRLDWKLLGKPPIT